MLDVLSREPGCDLLPVRDREKSGDEGVGGVRGIHDLGGGPPTLRGALLEEPERVLVAVIEIQQSALGHRRHEGYAGCPGTFVRCGHRGRDDRVRVARLGGGEALYGSCDRAGLCRQLGDGHDRRRRGALTDAADHGESEHEGGACDECKPGSDGQPGRGPAHADAP